MSIFFLYSVSTKSGRRCADKVVKIDLKSIFIFIEQKMREGGRYTKDFFKSKEIDYKTFMTTYSRIVNQNRDVQFGTVVKYLDSVGYEFMIVKKKKK